MDASEVIRILGLRPHPEGGWYSETFRDVAPEGGRSHSTAIYYLLERDDRSKWHRCDATEIWHFYAGAPLALSLSADGGSVTKLHLGMDLVAGERPQALVPANCWQSAQSLGAWTLVGCTVAPGFEFAGFTMAPPGWRPNGEE